MNHQLSELSVFSQLLSKRHSFRSLCLSTPCAKKWIHASEGRGIDSSDQTPTYRRGSHSTEGKTARERYFHRGALPFAIVESTRPLGFNRVLIQLEGKARQVKPRKGNWVFFAGALATELLKPGQIRTPRNIHFLVLASGTGGPPDKPRASLRCQDRPKTDSGDTLAPEISSADFQMSARTLSL